ncbi:MAG: DUF1905 domain-containing protein [Bacteroidota bacterium]
MSHQFATPLERSSSKLFNWQLRVPAAITAELLALPSKRRVVCAINGQDPHQCALTPVGQGVYVIKVNQGRIKKLQLEEGKSATLDLFPDDSKYGLPMPAEMEAVLAEDPAGQTFFNQLTLGKIRTLLYIVSQGKNSDDRLFRAVTILEHLKTRKGKIDYKALHYQDLKLS